MTLIFSLILSLFLKSSSCQLPCAKEILDDKEFSINMTEHVTVEAEDCIWIPFKFIFPISKVTAPYKKIWFRQDTQSIVDIDVVDSVTSKSKDSFRINGLPRGEYEYGFKLEWGCNQTYVFPKRLRISVSELSRKPTVMVFPMREGQPTRLTCIPARLCSGRGNIHWKSTKNDERFRMHDYNEEVMFDRHFWPYGSSSFRLVPTAGDHNTNITCVVEYDHSVVETTVTLSVKFAPRILNSSQCRVEGKQLVCVCIGWGNPLPPIIWPSASFTDYSVTSSSSIQTVNSTITMPVADYHNSTVKCISSNELGQTEFEIPLQNYTENDLEDRRQKSDGILPWTTAVSFSLNLILLASLIVCAYKLYKSKQKKLCEEMDTYASLNMADVGQEYSVISPRPR